MNRLIIPVISDVFVDHCYCMMKLETANVRSTKAKGTRSSRCLRESEVAFQKQGEKTPWRPGVLRQNACEGDLQTNSQNIKKELIKDIDKECTQLCSKKNPSCLRKTDKENILSFTMEKFYNELRERAPLFHSMLPAASVNSRNRSKAPQTEVLRAGTAMAATVCLRNRSKFMITVQLVITIFLYHSNWLVSYFQYLSY